MKVFSLAPLAMMLLIAQCRATSTNSNGTHRCDGPMDECFIIDVDLEVLLDTEINSRLLAGQKPDPVTDGTGNRNKPVADCGRKGASYASCLHEKTCPYWMRGKCQQKTSSLATDRVANTCGIYKGSKCSW